MCEMEQEQVAVAATYRSEPPLATAMRRLLSLATRTAAIGPCVYIGEQGIDDRMVFGARQDFLFKGADGFGNANVLPDENGTPKPSAGR